MEDRLPEITDKLVEQALAGDMAAAKLVLDRIMPPLRPVDPPIPRLDIHKDSTPAEAAKVILDCMGRGEISPGQAIDLLKAIGAGTRIEAVGAEAADESPRLVIMEP